MSRIKRVRHVEDCLDQSVVKEFELNEPIDEPLMRAMAVEASLDYHPEFPRPYYRITRSLHYVIQGVIGNRTCRVTFSPSRPLGTERNLVGILDDGGPAVTGADSLASQRDDQDGGVG